MVVHGVAGSFTLGVLFNVGPRIGKYTREGMTRVTIEALRRSLDSLEPQELPAALRLIERYRSMHWIDDDLAEAWERLIEARLASDAGEGAGLSN